MISMNDFCINAVFVGISIFIVIFLGAVIAYPIYWFFNTQIELRHYLEKHEGRISIGDVYVTGYPTGWEVEITANKVWFTKKTASFTDLHVHKVEGVESQESLDRRLDKMGEDKT